VGRQPRLYLENGYEGSLFAGVAQCTLGLLSFLVAYLLDYSIGCVVNMMLFPEITE